MTPQFAQAVDPIFLYGLDLLDRIERNEQINPEEEHLSFRAMFDHAEAIVGAGREWELARYALVAWIDEVLVDTPWSGREWWSNNVLEVHEFNTRLCHQQFYVRSREATTLTSRDALEVFYDCVILGFRGLYRDPSSGRDLAERLNLPPDLAEWASQAALSVRLGQGRPPITEARRELVGAPPLKTRTSVVWHGLGVIMLLICNAVYFLVFFSSH